MQIANPIYDVVFKYLLEDKKVAKLLLSAILDKDVIDIEFLPQEYTTNIKEKSITIYRLDFKAKIKINNEYKLVLIELQKAKFFTDIMRFRKYLGKQYANENNYIEVDGIKKALPIITIYFIGYNLDKKLKDIPIIYVKRNYIDKSTNKIINTESEFIESLTHDSIIIQIEAIKKKKQKTLLEKILSIFDNNKVHTISINEKDYPKKYQPIIKRLIKAIADEIIINTMDIEDEIIEEIEIRERRYFALKEEREKALLRQQEILKEKLEALQKFIKAEEEKKKAEEEKRLEAKKRIKAEEEKKKAEEEKRLEAKRRKQAEEEKRKIEEEKKQAEEEKKQAEDRANQIALKFAKKLLDMGMSIEDVSKEVGIDVEELKILLQN